MTPAPRRASDVPGVVVLTAADAEEYSKNDAGFGFGPQHRRTWSPRSVASVAHEAAFGEKDEEGRGSVADDGRGGAKKAEARQSQPQPPLRSPRRVSFEGNRGKDPRHPLLKREGAVHPPPGGGGGGGGRVVTTSIDDSAVPIPYSPLKALRTHRRCLTDPGANQKLGYRGEDRSILDGLTDSLGALASELGDAHPRVGLLYNQIGTFHFRARNFDAAEEAYEGALECFRASYLNGHADDASYGHGIKASLAVASTLGNIGAVHWKTGRLKSAVAYLEQALEIQECASRRVSRRESRMTSDGYETDEEDNSKEDTKNGGSNGDDEERCEGSVEMAQTLLNLGIARTLKGDFPKAKKTLKRALDMFERTCGPFHVDVARVRDAQGRLYAARGKDAKALEMFNAALQIKSAILNQTHPSLLKSMMSVAAGHRRLGRLDEAEALLREVLEGQYVALLKAIDPAYKRSIMGLVGTTIRLIGEVQRERAEGQLPEDEDEEEEEEEDDDGDCAESLVFSASDGESQPDTHAFHWSADGWGF